MSGKYSFHLQSKDWRRDLPPKLIVGRRDNQTGGHVVLRLLAYLLFFRDRLHVGAQLHDDNIPFEPDLVELDYELRPRLWVECGDCGAPKLDKLAVKVPEAEIWVVKGSVAEAENLLRAMERADLRRNRYHVIGLDEPMFLEVCGLLQSRNQVFWLSGDFEPPNLQFDFNGLWFDTSFEVFHF